MHTATTMDGAVTATGANADLAMAALLGVLQLSGSGMYLAPVKGGYQIHCIGAGIIGLITANR